MKSVCGARLLDLSDLARQDLTHAAATLPVGLEPWNRRLSHNRKEARDRFVMKHRQGGGSREVKGPRARDDSLAVTAADESSETGDGRLVMQLVDNGVVRTHDGPGGWQVTVIECPNGLANVESRRGVTQVFVADLPVAGVNDPNRFAAAACTPEGDALVVARQAPLPLLVTPDGQRATPAHPDQDELLHLGEGDRLLILSASALEAMPSSVGTLLRGPTNVLLQADPIELLTYLVDGVGAGSGAIICRHSPPRRSVGQEDTGGGRL